MLIYSVQKIRVTALKIKINLRFIQQRARSHHVEILYCTYRRSPVLNGISQQRAAARALYWTCFRVLTQQLGTEEWVKVRILSLRAGRSAWIRAVAGDVNINHRVARGGRWGCSVGGGSGTSHTETGGSEMQARASYWWLVLMCVATYAHAARLLAVLPTNTRSHYVMYGRLVEALAKKHHHLTVISHFPMVRIRTNMTECYAV